MRSSITMGGIVFAVIAAGVMAPVAAATSTSNVNGSGADVVDNLRRQGYPVQINGSVDEPLSQCTVTGVHGLTDTGSLGTVYIDVDCPGND